MLIYERNGPSVRPIAVVTAPRDPVHRRLIVWLGGTDFRGDDYNKNDPPNSHVAGLASEGYPVIQVRCGNLGHAFFPTLLERCLHSLRWAKDNVKWRERGTVDVTLGGFGMAGSAALLFPEYFEREAGALAGDFNLASIVAYMAACRYYTPPPAPTYSSIITTTWSGGRHAARTALGLPQPPCDESAIEISPEFRFGRSHPPTLFLMGGMSLASRPQRFLPFAYALREHGVPVEIAIVTDKGNSARAIGGLDLVKSFVERRPGSQPRRNGDFSVLVRDGADSPWASLPAHEHKTIPFLLGFKTWADPLAKYPTRPLCHRSFPSALLAQDVSYYLYLPPSYASDPDRRFPVVYFILPSVTPPRQFGPGPISAVDASIRAGDIPEAIYVLPNRPAAAVDSGPEQARDSARAALGAEITLDRVVAAELVAHIDRTYRTVSGRKHRAIMGECSTSIVALRIGLTYPRVFGFVDMIAPQDGVLLSALAKLKLHLRSGIPALAMVQGDADHMGVAAARRAHRYLSAFGVPHTYTEIPGGGHDYLSVSRFARSMDIFDHTRRWTGFSRGCAQIDAAGADAPAVRHVQVNERVALTLFASQNAAADATLLIYLPGGNYFSDFWERTTGQAPAPRLLCGSEFRLAVVDYGTINGHDGAELLANCVAACRYLLHHARSLGVTPHRVGLIGVGAGACLAGLLVSDPRFTGEPGLDDEWNPRRVGALALCSCPSRLSSLDYDNWRDCSPVWIRQDRENATRHRFSRLWPNDEKWSGDLAETLVFTGPVQIVHGAEDSLVSPRQSTRLHARLLERRQTSGLFLLERHGHGDNHPTVQAALHLFFKTNLIEGRRHAITSPVDLVVTPTGEYTCDRAVDPFSRPVGHLEHDCADVAGIGSCSYLIHLPEVPPARLAHALYIWGESDRTAGHYAHLVDYVVDAMNAEECRAAPIVVCNPVTCLGQGEKISPWTASRIGRILAAIETRNPILQGKERMMIGFNRNGLNALAAGSWGRAILALGRGFEASEAERVLVLDAIASSSRAGRAAWRFASQAVETARIFVQEVKTTCRNRDITLADQPLQSAGDDLTVAFMEDPANLLNQFA